MTTDASHDLRPLDIFRDICRRQGRKIVWVAQQVGIPGPSLYRRLAGVRGYAWQPGEREAVARVLGVPPQLIWSDLNEREQTRDDAVGT